MARLARWWFISSSHWWSCSTRSSRSWNRRCLKNEPFTQPTRFSTDPFRLARYGQHTSAVNPSSSAA